MSSHGHARPGVQRRTHERGTVFSNDAVRINLSRIPAYCDSSLPLALSGVADGWVLYLRVRVCVVNNPAHSRGSHPLQTPTAPHTLRKNSNNHHHHQHQQPDQDSPPTPALLVMERQSSDDILPCLLNHGNSHSTHISETTGK
jgi:hypothetical protein